MTGGFDILGKALGSKGKYNLLTKVKNPGIDANNQSLIGAWGSAFPLAETALDASAKQYESNYPKVKMGTEQEIGFLGDYYSGENARQQALLRADRTTALRNALQNISFPYARNNFSRSAVAGQGGGGFLAGKSLHWRFEPVGD